MACGRWDVELGVVARLRSIVTQPPPELVRRWHPIRSLEPQPERAEPTPEQRAANTAAAFALLGEGLKSLKRKG